MLHKDLEAQYKTETGENATYTMQGEPLTPYHSLRYVRWLESLVQCKADQLAKYQVKVENVCRNTACQVQSLRRNVCLKSTSYDTCADKKL